MQIKGPATPVPRQWGKYLANPKEKVWLELFSSADFISTIGFQFRYPQFKAVAIVNKKKCFLLKISSRKPSFC